MAIQNGQTFFQFDPTEDIVSDRQKVSSGIWSGDAGTLLTAYLDLIQSASSGNYYLNVLNVVSNSVAPVADVQFAIAYGDVNGSGSQPVVSPEGGPSEAIYGQYKNVLLDPSDTLFTLNGINRTGIVVIALANSRFRQSIDPGNWQLSFSGSNGKITTVTDDSGQTLSPNVGRSGRVFNIVTGSIANGTGSANFGLIYPDMGILIFDPYVLATSASINVSGTGSNVPNSVISNVFTAISGAMSAGQGFIARREEEISSTHYFVRVKSAADNFSNNPTFVTGSLGDLLWSQMLNNPTVYMTTIGLYDSQNELLAVAKLSQPLKKTFTNEALIRVKLDF